jgi:hypothetical protein
MQNAKYPIPNEASTNISLCLELRGVEIPELLQVRAYHSQSYWGPPIPRLRSLESLAFRENARYKYLVVCTTLFYDRKNDWEGLPLLIVLCRLASHRSVRLEFENVHESSF